MIRILSVISLLALSNELWAQNSEPCHSDELRAAFIEQKHIEYEIDDDWISIVVTVPVELPNVSIGGIFLIRDVRGKRILQAPLVHFSDTPEHNWTAVSFGKDLAHDYAIAVTYYLVQTYPDACWYEFTVQVDRQNTAN